MKLWAFYAGKKSTRIEDDVKIFIRGWKSTSEGKINNNEVDIYKDGSLIW